MFQKSLEKMRKNEGGFTLIELLVVMIIIGLLAAIAIPVFMSQKDKARDSAVQSDLRNAAIQVETAAVNSTTGAYVADQNLAKSNNVAIAMATNGTTYCLVGAFDGGNKSFLGSTGKLTKVDATHADPGAAVTC